MGSGHLLKMAWYTSLRYLGLRGWDRYICNIYGQKGSLVSADVRVSTIQD